MDGTRDVAAIRSKFMRGKKVKTRKPKHAGYYALKKSVCRLTFLK